MQKGDENDAAKQVKSSSSGDGTVPTPPSGSPASRQGQGVLPQFTVTSHLQALTPEAAQTALGLVHGVRGTLSSAAFTLTPALSSVVSSPQTVGRLLSAGSSAVSGSPLGQPAVVSGATINVLQRQLSGSVMGIAAVTPQLLPSSTIAQVVSLASAVESSSHKLLLSQSASGQISSISASGSTIHHHGQSPVKGPTPTTSNLLLNSGMNTQGHESQTQARRPSLGSAPSSARQGHLPGAPQGVASLGVRQNPSPAHGPPPKKKIKLEEKPPPTTEVADLRRKILAVRHKRMCELKESHIEHLTEMFFLQNRGNIMEYHAWKKRPTPQLVQFLKTGHLDSDEEEDRLQEKRINDEVKVLTSAGSNVPVATPVAISTTLPPMVSALNQQGTEKLAGRPQTGAALGISLLPASGTSSAVPSSAAGTSSAGLVAGGLTPHGATTTTSNNTTSQLQLQLSKAVGDVKPFSIATSQATKTPISAVSSLTPGSMKTKSPGQTPLSPRQHTRQHSISAVYDSSAGSQEAIVERAKQEVDVLERVNALRKEGLWSQRKLPKVQEPARQKAHWDYLLEEVQWLATDFVQERKWKKASARKLARGVQKHFQDLEQKELRAEKEEGMKLKRLASQMAKMVKEFWINIEKVVQYKQKMIMEEKRKKALDIHLSYIVDQTEKYSSWLQKGLQAPASISGSISSPCHSSDHGDDDFEPIQNASDDEETIAREEEEAEEDDEATRLELEELQKEGEMSIEELLQSLPQEVLDKPAKLPSSDEEADSVCSETNGGDADFAAEAENDEDVEETIEEAEEADKAEADYAHEIDDLETENNMTVEELRAKYAGAYDSDFEFPQTSTESESDDDSDDESDSSEQEEEEEDMEVEEEASSPESEQPEIGLEYLMKPEEGNDTQEEDPSKKGPGKEITDIAAEAQSLQPKGYTLETTEVKTPVPFLLKHSLREYQHVGLDWLATLFEKRLNGILADEMGLGKTIQTIALLAHLAGTKGIWGPHLIVVPTSVMLNWEMEFKKWCPAFKILTYYGTQKERKMKRQGWTKTNAFHVCITSYKLVVQDHAAFRRKKWKYLILDEAQNIKNFKSQRWQMLLNFNSQRRLLLTGTPLQNSLMELWSLMHFLMPNVFQSAKEFKEWFSNPLTGMIEGSQEYNDNLIKRLHRVLRPFLLRRLKDDVEKQMPKKYEHVIMCRLSKRQRYLYDDFMAQAKTKETLASGHFMSVINVLMQLRKVCNHPNLFDPRPTISPFQMEGLTYHTASLVLRALEDNPFRDVDIRLLYPSLSEMDANLPKFVAERVQELQTPRKLIEEIDDQPDPPPPLKPGKLRIPSSLAAAVSQAGRASSPLVPICQAGPSSPVQIIKTAPVRGIVPSLVASSPAAGAGIRPLTRPTQLAVTSGNKVQLVSAVTTSAPAVSGLPASAPGSQPRVLPQQIQVSGVLQSGSTQPITLQIQPSENGTKVYVPATSEHGARVILPGNISGGLWTVVQTPSGQQLVPTTAAPSAVSTPSTAASSKANGAGAAASTVPGTTKGVTTTTTSAVKATEASSASTTTSTTALTGSTSGNGVTTTAARLLARKEERKTPFYLRALSEKRVRQREDKLDYLARTNAKRCDLDPVWPQDLLDIARQCQTPERTGVVKDTWRGQSSAHIQATVSCSNPDHPNHFWQMTSHLREAVLRPDERFCECKALLERFVFATPPVAAPCIQMRVSHPHPSNLNEMRCREFQVHQRLSSGTAPFHKIMTNGRVQFPELRLIQYDCGKLQALDQLLRKLKSGNHRVLIFTQMTRMLDVFEAFLNYHGHRYLRLDGTTKVDQRQALMERFNADKRIFCFILSTRSGGIGVNLTGADTVIFYDSDWNPTMDAQAQDRCHRIGQTRDVHIYRLICEKTVEENILKKANQKRLLGDLAIEGGNFTTAFFKEQTIKELFAEPSGLDSLAKEKEREAQEKALKREQRVETPMETEEGESSISGQVLAQYEQALGKAEDETDAMAASLVKAEQKAELDEFDENIPWDEKEAEARQTEELTRTEMELLQLDKELSCIERYAVAVMEAQIEPEVQEELALAEEDIEQAKTEWEFARLKALKEEEERRAELEEDEMLFTYAREENSNQVKKRKRKNKNKHMSIYDVYLESSESEPDVVTEDEKPVMIKQGPRKPPKEKVPKVKVPKEKVPRQTVGRPRKEPAEKNAMKPRPANKNAANETGGTPPPKAPRRRKSQPKPSEESGESMPPLPNGTATLTPELQAEATAPVPKPRKRAPKVGPDGAIAGKKMPRAPGGGRKRKADGNAASPVVNMQQAGGTTTAAVSGTPPTVARSVPVAATTSPLVSAPPTIAVSSVVVGSRPNLTLTGRLGNTVGGTSYVVVPSNPGQPQVIPQNVLATLYRNFVAQQGGAGNIAVSNQGPRQVVPIVQTGLQQRPILKVPVLFQSNAGPRLVSTQLNLVAQAQAQLPAQVQVAAVPRTAMPTSPPQPPPVVKATPLSPKDNSVPQPWSNPNLVIRTRRANQNQPYRAASTSEASQVNLGTLSVGNSIQAVVVNNSLQIPIVNSQAMGLSTHQIVPVVSSFASPTGTTQTGNYVVVSQKEVKLAPQPPPAESNEPLAQDPQQMRDAG